MMNEVKIELLKNDCHCGIIEFFDKIAEKLGYDPQRVRYDCTKICVSKPVQDEIYAYYKETMHAELIDINITWLKFGPKANLPHNTYKVNVQKGFIQKGE